MLAVMVKIGNIDYEKTLKAIFPWIAEQIRQQESDFWPARLIRSLGDDAATVALGVFSRLPKESREELLVYCVNGYGQVRARKANEALSRKFGSCFSIGMLLMERDEGIHLQIRQIRAAYNRLAEQLLPQRMPRCSGCSRQMPAETPLPFSHDTCMSESLKGALCDALVEYLRELLPVNGRR